MTKIWHVNSLRLFYDVLVIPCPLMLLVFVVISSEATEQIPSLPATSDEEDQHRPNAQCSDSSQTGTHT